jgi:hypothetical protein
VPGGITGPPVSGAYTSGRPGWGVGRRDDELELSNITVARFEEVKTRCNLADPAEIGL